MKYRVLDAKMLLPLPLDSVFAFFSDTNNLDRLTPPWFDFRTLTPGPIAMAAGVRIDHELRVRWIPIRWQSEITLWNPPYEFVDEQRRGPYRHWMHRHLFEPVEGGTLVRDHVEFLARGWICEPLIHRFLIERDLRAIFTYRHQRIRELLAPGSDGSADVVAFA